MDKPNASRMTSRVARSEWGGTPLCNTESAEQSAGGKRSGLLNAGSVRTGHIQMKRNNKKTHRVAVHCPTLIKAAPALPCDNVRQERNQEENKQRTRVFASNA